MVEGGISKKITVINYLLTLWGGKFNYELESWYVCVIFTFKGSFLVYFWFLKILWLDLESKWPLFEGTFSITLISSQPYLKTTREVVAPLENYSIILGRSLWFNMNIKIYPSFDPLLYRLESYYSLSPPMPSFLT